MHNILHRVIIETTPTKLYQALTQQQELSEWWTNNKASTEVGGIIHFEFRPQGEHKVDMEIIELISDQKVRWRCVNGPWEGIGEFCFDIQTHERGAILHFAHTGWSETDDFYMHCNCKWGFFLGVSLKKYLETGQGKPHPQDPNF